MKLARYTQVLLLIMVMTMSISCAENSFQGTSKQQKLAPENDDAVSHDPVALPEDDHNDHPTPISQHPVVLTPAQPVKDDGGCTQLEPGFVGKVYRLAENTPSLPNFASMTPVGEVKSLQLNVPTRLFTEGFPGVDNLVEWFAISFTAQLNINESGPYWFKTFSDDGSNLYIDDQLAVDNDGIHSPAPAQSIQAIQLSKGTHTIRVDWYQGPRHQIALQVMWTTPQIYNNAVVPPNPYQYQIIPSSVVFSKRDCSLKDLGTF